MSESARAQSINDLIEESVYGPKGQSTPPCANAWETSRLIASLEQKVNSLETQLKAVLKTLNAGKPVTRQYFYRNSSCDAPSDSDPSCICWHDEGTGPLADDLERIRVWRPKPDLKQKPAEETLSDSFSCSSLTPIPLSERKPEDADCDSKGRCWYGRVKGNMATWDLYWFCPDDGNTHWLPHWVFPLPDEEW